MIRSTSELVNCKSANQDEDALIFFSSLETQSTLESMTTFSRVGNPWGYHLNNPFSFLRVFQPWACLPLLPNYRPSSNSNRQGKCIREDIYSHCAPKKHSNSLSILFSIFPRWLSHHSCWPYFPTSSCLLYVFFNLGRLL